MIPETKRGRRPHFADAATLIIEPSPWEWPPRGLALVQPHHGTGTFDPFEEDAEFAAVSAPDPQLPARSPFHHCDAGGVCPNRSIELVHAPDSATAAQWRLLRFKLQAHGDPRALAISSATQGEGKSVVAANLALCLAEGRRARVVLLEANLRTPSLGALFGLQVPLDLTEQLRRRRRDREAGWELYELSSDFFFLPCSRPAENPAAVLASAQFTELVRDLRRHYDYVVVDTPGVLVAADLNIVQELVQGVVMVCRGGVSTRPQLKKALGRPAQHNLVGLVLVDAR